MTDRELFIAALEHADPAERAAWLDQACADDPDRRRRLDVLLGAHDQASRFLANPARPPADPDDATRTAHPSDDTSPAPAIDVLALLAPADRPGLLGKLDHYEVLEVVGKGGMGVVFKAFDPKLHRLVAVKLMAPHLAAHAGARKRFDREAKAVAAVKNEHVVAIHGVETEGPAPYLVMEFVGGISLQERLERCGPFDVKEILRIGMQTARGLSAAHAQGIVHRDIKPANILLENGVERVKITDFGLARAAADANLTQSGMITGTPNYMSPEQAAGATATAQSDLFSLGSVLYALCTGHPPFRAETPLAVLRRVADDPVRPPREVNPDIPDWLDAIVRKLLAKNPADRFQSANEVADLLGQHLAHLQQPDAVPMPPAVSAPVNAPEPAAERTWTQIFEATDTRKWWAQYGLLLLGLMLIGWEFIAFMQARVDDRLGPEFAGKVGLHFLVPGPAPLRVPILILVGVLAIAAIAVGDQYFKQRWEVPYKGRTLRFENSFLSAESLFVDGVRIARGLFVLGFRREIRGTISDGPGAGDEIRAKVTRSIGQLRCELYARPGPGLLRSVYESPAAHPPAAPTGQAGFAWLVVIGLVSVPALLFWTQPEFWDGYFRPGYVAPVSMLVTSGLFLAVLRWCRRQSEPRWYRFVLALAMAAVVGGTLIGLMISWGEGSYLDKLGGASTWHNGGIGVAAALVIVSALVRAAQWMASRPAVEPEAAQPGPIVGRHGPTAFALGAGSLVLTLGFVVSLFVRELVTPEGGRARTLAFLTGIWSTAALLAFGPGVFAARRWSRKRLPEDRRADARAVVLAGLGFGATIMLAVLTVVRTPDLRRELFGPSEPSSSMLVVHWNLAHADRVRLERDGSVVAEETGTEARLMRSVAPGSYTVRGFKGDREVYVESFALEPTRDKVISMFTGGSEPDGAYLRVICDDRGVSVTATGAGHTFAFSHPGFQSVVGQRLATGEPYRLSIARGQDVLHTETVQLKPAEQREIRIPHIVLPDRTVELKPKAGSFPTDVVRMQLSPDRSAVAAGRFDGPILMFDVVTGRERFTISRPKSHCTAFGFTPDGKRLAFLARTDDGSDHVLRWVDTRDGKPAGMDLQPQPGRAFFNSHALAFSPDGTRLAVATAQNIGSDNRFVSRVHRWDLASAGGPRELSQFEGRDGTITDLRFTADGSGVRAVSGTDEAMGWNWRTGQEELRYHAELLEMHLLAAAQEFVIVAGRIRQSGRAIVAQIHPTPPPESPADAPVAYASLGVSTDGRRLAAGTKGVASVRWEERAAVHVWDRVSGKESAILLGHTDWVLDLAFSPDGMELISAGKDGTLRSWKLP